MLNSGMSCTNVFRDGCDERIAEVKGSACVIAGLN